jgi:hypothetical protein
MITSIPQCNKRSSAIKYVLALRMLIALAFRKKRQQVRSGSWQFGYK